MAKKNLNVATLDNDGNKTLLSAQSSDLPFSPTELEQIHNLNPDYANRLLSMAEKEQTERHYAEKEKIEFMKKEQKLQYRDSIFGKMLAFLIVLFFFSLIAFSLYLKSPYFASASLLSLAAILGYFVKNNNIKNK